VPITPLIEEKQLRFDRMSGLDPEQLDDLEHLVGELLGGPWDKPNGRFGMFLRAAATDSVHGVQHMIQEVGKGKIVPTILPGAGNGQSLPCRLNPRNRPEWAEGRTELGVPLGRRAQPASIAIVARYWRLQGTDRRR
jgi:hypothetical protein